MSNMAYLKDELRYYKLVGREVVPCRLMEWAEWFETGDRNIARDQIGEVIVSTVFIGVEDNLFETMIFGGELDRHEWRCSTYNQALEQHAEAVDSVKEESRYE